MIDPIDASSHLEKMKKIKTSPKAKVYVTGFVFAGRDTMECVVGFRIDNHTIMRETLT